MAPRRSTKAQYRQDTVLLEKHVEELRKFTRPSIAAYAKAHNLPYYRLRRAYLGLPNRCNRTQSAQNYRLTETQDLALVRYLEAIDAIGFGVHRTMIEQQANFLISEAYLGSNEAPPVIGKQWARRWLKKHPQFKRIKAKPLDI